MYLLIENSWLNFGTFYHHFEVFCSQFDLGIITQNLVSNYDFRCDEIAKDASQEFDGEIKSLQESIDRGNIIEGLGGIMEARRGSALGEFEFSILLPT